MTTQPRTAVHFGAGIIGRGFIADLLHRSGYRIIFVDVDPSMTRQLNQAGGYRILSVEDPERFVEVTGASALCIADDREAIINAIAEASVLTTSVWADNLPRVAGIIGEGLRRRRNAGGHRINVMACENAVGASTRLQDAVQAADAEYWAMNGLDTVARFPNCSVDRMVFRPAEPGSLDVLASDSFELAIEQNRLVDPAEPPIQDAVYSRDIGAHVERKLWVVNGGHAVAGFLAAHRGWGDTRETFVQDDTRELITSAMGQAATAVAAKHGFTMDEMYQYIDKAVRRYQLPRAHYLTPDVARAPLRKLAASDRLVGPATYCEEHQLPNDHLVTGIALALLYDEPTDRQSVELQQLIANEGLAVAISQVSGIQPGTDLSQRVQDRVEQLRGESSTEIKGKGE